MNPGRWLAAVLLTLLMGAGALEAQDRPEQRDWIGAAPPVPEGHWALGALRRMEALGLVHRTAPPQGSVPASVIAHAFEEAEGRADGMPAATTALLRSWAERFEREYPHSSRGARTQGLRHELRGSVGSFHAQGRAAPGVGEFEDDPARTGAIPLPDVTQLRLGGGGHWTVTNLVGLDADAVIGSGVTFRRLQGYMAAGPVQLTVGRGEAGSYGFAEGGGVVLSSVEPLDRVEVQTLGGYVLPGILGYLGPVGFHTSLGVLTDARHPGNPYFWSATGTLRPFDRLSVSVHRAAIIGGALADAYGDEVTFLSVLLMMVGKHTDFEDQIVSAEFRLRPPTEPWLPMTLYMEWGAEDSAGAFKNVPGRIFGVFLPALPGLPQLAGGIERTEFHPSCCGNPKWYRHWQFPGGWAMGDRTLAHPLGGEGEEWAGHLSFSAPGAGLDLRGRIFTRERGPENLFVPGRGGTSRGFEVAGTYALGRSGLLELSASREGGEGWRETVLHTRGTVFFRGTR